MVRRFRGGDVDAATLRKYIHHPDYVVRSAAAKSIHWHGTEMLMTFLRCEDARVRRAALEGVKGSADKLMQRNVFDHVIGMIGDPEESWYVKDAAIKATAKAPQDWIVEKVDQILPFLKHDEWWLQRSALEALAPVVADERCYKKVLPAIGELLQSNYRYNLSGVMRWGTLPDNLRKASPPVQELARDCMKQAYVNFVEYDHPSQQVVNVVNPMTLEARADSLVKVPGGYDVLYQIGWHPCILWPTQSERIRTNG